MSTEISTFGFHGSNVRVATDGHEVWFCGRDICEQLEYRNSNDAIKQHCRGVAKRYPIVDALGRTQEAVFLSEPDVWRLICSSHLPKAVELERWIFEEVLPTLRRTGRYDVGSGRERVSSVTPQVINVQATGLVTLRLTPDGQGSFSLEVNYRTPGKGQLANGKKQNAMRFLMDTVEESAYSSIQACCLYDEYYRWCERHDYLALNNITFGKVVFQLFPGVHRSRQWVDQSSRGYFYAGLDYRQPDAASPPPAAKPWMEGEL